MKKIFFAAKIGIWAYKNPKIFNEHNFKMLCSLLEMILKVAKERRHLMSKIALIYPDSEEQEIVSIWAGSGICSNPTDRISELISENEKLKFELSNQIKNK